MSAQKDDSASSGGSKSDKEKPARKLSGGDLLLKGFLHIHETSGAQFQSLATPRRFMAFMRTYESIYRGKKGGIEERQKHLKAGVSKLNEAKEVVDNLKQKAGKQSKVNVIYSHSAVNFKMRPV